MKTIPKSIHAFTTNKQERTKVLKHVADNSIQLL